MTETGGPEPQAVALRRERAARQAKNRAALRRAKGAKDEVQQAVERAARQGNDLGAELAIARGIAEVDQQALIPDDPSQKDGPQRNGARAQRVWAPDRLSRGRSPALEPHHRQAAERFLNDWLVGECGARSGVNISGVHVAPWSRFPFSERRVIARSSFRGAVKAAGGRFMSVLMWCVLQETGHPNVAPTVETWARAHGWRVERATGFLVGALESLSVHYGLADGPVPPRRD